MEYSSYRMLEPGILARATIDRASYYRMDQEWLEAAWSSLDARVLIVGEGRVSMNESGLALHSTSQAPKGERFLLGVHEKRAIFAVHVEGRPDKPATLRDAGALLGDEEIGLAVHAIALANWHETHRFCPRCGHATITDAAGHIRRCVNDGSEHYPRIDPAVIMVVTDPDDRCLLGRGAQWPGRRFSTLAGYVEPGETPEQAVAREVAEEVGIRVTSCSYAGSQPWPFPSVLMLGYYATASDTELTPDGEEIAEARWFSREDIATALASGDIKLPGPLSIARNLVRGWYGQPLPDEE